MSNRHTVDPINFTVEIFNDVQEQPMLRQPTWPNGTAWESAQSAEEWAQLFIESLNNESAPYAPAGPGQLGAPKPTEEELAQWMAFSQPTTQQ